jgi:hypothetical protein
MASQHVRRPDWTCPECHHEVFGSKDECFKCGKWRPRPAPTTREGDWTCPGCRASVFASKSRCFKCDTPKPGSSSGSSSKPALERRSGDWDCKSCGTCNFASRPICFKCSKLKTWEPPKDTTSSAQCVVCLDAQVDTILLTCGHACMCGGCAEAVDGTCPMCRESFAPTDVKKMFLS